MRIHILACCAAALTLAAPTASADVVRIDFGGTVIATDMYDGVELEDRCLGSFEYERDVAPTATGPDNAFYHFSGDTPRSIFAKVGSAELATVPGQLFYGLVDDDVDGDFFQLRASRFDPSVGKTVSYILQFTDPWGAALTSTELPGFESLELFALDGTAELLVLEGASFFRCRLEKLHVPVATDETGR